MPVKKSVVVDNILFATSVDSSVSVIGVDSSSHQRLQAKKQHARQELSTTDICILVYPCLYPNTLLSIYPLSYLAIYLARKLLLYSTFAKFDLQLKRVITSNTTFVLNACDFQAAAGKVLTFVRNFSILELQLEEWNRTFDHEMLRLPRNLYLTLRMCRPCHEMFASLA